MVSIQDLEKLIDDYMLDKNIEFGELKPYILTEFEWNVDRMKKLEFIIRGKVIPNEMKVSDVLATYLPMETLIIKEV